MRKPLILSILVATAGLFTACKKDHNTTPLYSSPRTIYVPMYDDTTLYYLFTSPSVVLSGPSPITDIDGLLLTNNIVMHLSDSTGNSGGSFSRSWALARFWDSTAYNDVNYWTNAWNVSLNNVNIPWDTAQFSLNNYLRQDVTNTLWNWNGNNQWNISGSNMTPAVSQSINGNMPQFTGPVPDTISVHGTISFTFDASNTIDADSAYFFVYDNGASISSAIGGISHVVGTNGGTASISFANTPGLANGRYLIRSQYYTGALLMIVLYQHEIHTLNGKQIAFVKQRQLLRNVYVK